MSFHFSGVNEENHEDFAQQSLQDGGIPTAPVCPVSPLRPFSYVLPSFSLFSSPHPHLSSASHLALFSPERAQSLLSSVSLPRAPSCERQNQGTALQAQGKPLCPSGAVRGARHSVGWNASGVASPDPSFCDPRLPLRRHKSVRKRRDKE